MKTYSVFHPKTKRPVFVEVPHAGLGIPPEISNEIAVSEQSIKRDADIYVDDLYADAPAQGATTLVSHVSRYVVDLNRAQDDVDQLSVHDHPCPKPLSPRGVVWRMTTEGHNVLPKPLTLATFNRRLEQLYYPYHQCLQNELLQLREQFGHVVVIAAHSMPSMGRSGHQDTGHMRADVVPGTRGRTSASPAVIDLVDAHFREAGLTVKHDDPYQGGWTTVHYGRPEQHQHVIQIELNRALYVDEHTFEIRKPAFVALQTVLASLVRKVADAELPL